MAFNRKSYAGHSSYFRRIAGCSKSQFVAFDKAASCLDSDDFTGGNSNSGNLAVLNYVHPSNVGCASVTPSDRVVTDSTAARLK